MQSTNNMLAKGIITYVIHWWKWHSVRIQLKNCKTEYTRRCFNISTNYMNVSNSIVLCTVVDQITSVIHRLIQLCYYTSFELQTIRIVRFPYWSSWCNTSIIKQIITCQQWLTWICSIISKALIKSHTRIIQGLHISFPQTMCW